VHGVINVLSCAAYVGARLDFQPFDAERLWMQWAGGNEDNSLQSTTFTDLPKPTVFMAVPTIYAKLLEAADKLPKDTVSRAVEQTLSPMRLMVSGSAALPVSVLKNWKRLTGHTLLERYGMTEFAMALSNPYQESDTDPVQARRPGYVGRPLPSVKVRLVDQETDEVLETSGVSGELQVKGPTVFQKYLNRPDATKEAFTKDGYFRTGDIAQYDGDGIESYRILGRASVDIIKSGGYKLSALEIERELLEHPDIAEVAILGLPDDTWGERVAMICRLKESKTGTIPEITLDSLRSWCGDRLSKYKIPSRLKVVSEIPKNAMGKINKKALGGTFTE
jgi:malonyl-CoA/methylmalonyl-CoA synthetase